MSESPLLSEDDIREEVRALHQKRHRSLWTALRGRGEAGALTVRVESEQREVRFLVEPVTCELSLRRALWHEQETPKILLVEGVPTLPHDLLGRLARGEIQEVTEARRLARLFAATAVSPLLATSPVGHALLEPPAIRPPPIQGSTVDLETGLRALLAARADLPSEGALSEERLLAFFATHPLSTTFARQLGVGSAAPEGPSATGGQALRAAIGQHLGERHGQAAALAFKAWCRGQGERAVALIFVLEAAASKPSNNYLRALLLLLLQGIDPQATNQTLRGLSEPPDAIRSLAARLHLRLGQDKGPPGALASVLAEADRLLPDAKALELLDESLFLPSSFERGLGKLAQQLGVALEAGGASSVNGTLMLASQKTLEHLSRHVLAGEPSRRERLDRARMGARLVAWLASSETDGRNPGALGSALAVEGGLVERALDASAGIAEGPLRDVVERARAAAQARLAVLQSTFTQATASGLVPAAVGALAPENVLDQVVIPFLSGKPTRRLLMVLVPGLRWADVHELLERLERPERDEQPPQAMLAFRGETGARGEGSLPLPPLVGGMSEAESLSRVLAGRVAAPGQILDEPRDGSRFSSHEVLRALSGTDAPLYLPAQEALLVDGGQKETVARSMTSATPRVLAVGLPATTGGRRQSDVIVELLRQASEAGRATLLVSCGEAGAEGVWPLLLMGSAWLETLADERDTELQLLPPPRLPFWQLEVPARATGKSSKRPRPSSVNQLPLLPPTLSLRERLERLFGSPGRPVAPRVLDVVETLYQTDSGMMSEEDLGRKMNVFGPRVGGLVARASEVVSQDGFELLTYDHHARMAKLSKETLKQLLEETNR